MFGSTRVIDQKKYNELEPGDIFIVERLGIGNNPYEVYSIWWMFNHPSPPDGSILFSPLTDTTIKGVVYKHENLYVKSASPFNKLDSKEIDKEFKFYTVDCEDYPYIIKDFINQRSKPVILHHFEEGEKMEPRHVNGGEDNMPKTDMNTTEPGTIKVVEVPDVTEHAYSDNAVKDLLSSIDDNLSAISNWMKSVDDRIKILEKRERFKENLNNQLDLHDDVVKSQLIKKSNAIGGYFSALIEDSFPIIPWSDDVAMIPANTAELEWDTESECFCQTGEYTNYNCITKIKTVKMCNECVYGSIACGADDEISWYDLTAIKEKLNPCVDSAYNYIYEIEGDGIEPIYIETYALSVPGNKFMFIGKVDMSGTKYITIISTCITAIENDEGDMEPIALVKIRCRDDENFTNNWIKYSDLMKMD